MEIKLWKPTSYLCFPRMPYICGNHPDSIISYNGHNSFTNNENISIADNLDDVPLWNYPEGVTLDLAKVLQINHKSDS